jgi:hypothetical protein
MKNSCYAQKESSPPILEYEENVNCFLLLVNYGQDCQKNRQIKGISEIEGIDKNAGERIVLMQKEGERSGVMRADIGKAMREKIKKDN